MHKNTYCIPSISHAIMSRIFMRIEDMPVFFRKPFLLALIFSVAASTFAQSAPKPTPPQPLPPLGWSSWNSFSNTINSAITQSQADAMHASSLAKAGYQFINIDEGWWLGERDAEGNIVVDPKAWPAIAPGEKPGDMANIVRYIHAKGLKAGIYTDAGKNGCSMYPDLGPAYWNVGAEGHYEQDFLQFARWGFDYVKVDWCGGDKEGLDPAVQYAEIARAIDRAAKLTGNRLYYSICNWGRQNPASWGPGIGGSHQAIWRTSDDIVAPVVAGSINESRKVAFDKMLHNFDLGIHPEAQHTGFYNDPDMMVLGMPGLSPSQNRLHLALWAISAAPLLIGADLTRLDPETTAALANPTLVAIDQDPLGLQSVKVKELGPGLEIWSKYLAGSGRRAVVLLNRTYFPAPFAMNLADLGLTDAKATVRDLWANRDLPVSSGKVEAVVPAQDGILLTVEGGEGEFHSYQPTAQPGALAAEQTLFAALPQGSQPWKQIRIHYQNKTAASQLVELFVNGQTGTRISLPPTGADSATVWIEANFDRPTSKNQITFTNINGVSVEALDVH